MERLTEQEVGLTVVIGGNIRETIRLFALMIRRSKQKILF
jgi:ABC-type tungstate transport system substrate-binding protein